MSHFADFNLVGRIVIMLSVWSPPTLYITMIRMMSRTILNFTVKGNISCLCDVRIMLLYYLFFITVRQKIRNAELLNWRRWVLDLYKNENILDIFVQLLCSVMKGFFSSRWEKMQRKMWTMSILVSQKHKITGAYTFVVVFWQSIRKY